MLGLTQLNPSSYPNLNFSPLFLCASIPKVMVQEVKVQEIEVQEVVDRHA